MKLVSFVVAVLAITGCRDSMSPVFNLTGDWNYSFTARSATSCDPVPVVQGCGGAGLLQLEHVANTLTGTYTERSACQSCGSAWDYGGTFELVNAEVSGGNLHIRINVCDFTAPLPNNPIGIIDGTVTCDLGNSETAEGTWRLVRDSVQSRIKTLRPIETSPERTRMK